MVLLQNVQDVYLIRVAQLADTFWLGVHKPGCFLVCGKGRMMEVYGV